MVSQQNVDAASGGKQIVNSHSMLNLEGLWQLLQMEPQPLSLKHLLARIQAENHIQEDDQTILSLEIL